VNNGGYLKSYKLLESPKDLTYNFRKQMSQQIDGNAYKAMHHPSYLSETEKIIRYQAQQIAIANDQEKMQGSTTE
jgi:hypothetical protein